MFNFQNQRVKWLNLIALFLMALVPATTFLRPNVPRTNDLFPHLYRTIALDAAIPYAGLWPRWAPDLVHGFGYPVFNYFPSLSHWTIELFHLVGLPMTTAYRAAVVLHFFMAAVFAYMLGRRLFKQHRMAAWTLALVYTYSPYLLYDVIVRGAPPETQALAILPLWILALDHLTDPDNQISTGWLGRWVGTRPGWFLIAALSYAAMILSHHPVALQMSFLVGLWLLMRAWRVYQKLNAGPMNGIWQALRPALLALFLGGMLTAFFSIPGLLEIDYTRAQLSISQGYTYQTNFLPFRELLRFPVTPADSGRINPPVVRAIPQLALIAAALILIGRWRKIDQSQRPHIWQWSVLLALAVWLITPSSELAWEILPLLKFTLYPWRLLGFVSLATAILAGYAIEAWPMRVRPSLLQRFPILFRLPPRAYTLMPAYGLTLLVALGTIPWLFAPREPVAENAGIAEMSRAEVPPFLIGTTTLGEFLPRWVEELPYTADLQNELITQGNPDRLTPQDGVMWERLNPNPIDATYAISADLPATLTYRQFYFPGWQATLDGQPLEIAPSSPHGLITFELPAGNHELHIEFGNTPLQTVSNLISILIAVTLVGLYTAARVTLPVQSRETAWQGRPSESAERVAGLLTPALVVLWVFLLTMLVENPLRRDTLLESGIWGKPEITPLDYAGDLRLLTFEPQRIMVSASEPVPLTVYWQPQRKIHFDYAVGVQIVDANGLVWSDGDAYRPLDWRFVAGDEPWPLDGYRLDPFLINLLDGTPPGEYQFLVGLVRKDNGQTVAAHTLGHIQVTAHQERHRRLEDGMNPHSQTDAFYLGGRTDRRQAQPGDPVRIDTMWGVGDDGEQHPQEYLLTLVNEDGQAAIERPITIVPELAQAKWEPDSRFRSVEALRLPAGLESGSYHWQVEWDGQTAEFATLDIAAPDRIFEIPEHDIEINVDLGEQVKLIGATVMPSSLAADQPKTIDVILHWQALAETADSYRIFAHFIDENGQLVTQSDGEPALWQRPTTGWLPPEIVTDTRTLNLPSDIAPGRYTIMVGMYNPVTGQRLRTADGINDTIEVMQFDISE